MIKKTWNYSKFVMTCVKLNKVLNLIEFLPNFEFLALFFPCFNIDIFYWTKRHEFGFSEEKFAERNPKFETISLKNRFKILWQWILSLNLVTLFQVAENVHQFETP